MKCQRSVLFVWEILLLCVVTIVMSLIRSIVSIRGFRMALDVPDRIQSFIHLSQNAEDGMGMVWG